jgi:hypothetical protein
MIQWEVWMTDVEEEILVDVVSDVVIGLIAEIGVGTANV